MGMLLFRIRKFTHLNWKHHACHTALLYILIIVKPEWESKACTYLSSSSFLIIELLRRAMYGMHDFLRGRNLKLLQLLSCVRCAMYTLYSAICCVQSYILLSFYTHFRHHRYNVTVTVTISVWRSLTRVRHCDSEIWHLVKLNKCPILIQKGTDLNNTLLSTDIQCLVSNSLAKCLKPAKYVLWFDVWLILVHLISLNGTWSPGLTLPRVRFMFFLFSIFICL